MIEKVVENLEGQWRITRLNGVLITVTVSIFGIEVIKNETGEVMLQGWKLNDFFKETGEWK